MKRIMCFVLALLSLLSVFALGVSAAADAAGDSNGVMYDLAQMRVNGETFDQSQYPVDLSRSDLEVLGVAEVGFKSKTSSPDFAMYIYLYNPGCLVFENSANDYVQIGLNVIAESFKYYGLELDDISDDNRFLRCKVTAYGQNIVKELWAQHENSGERVYNIPGLKLVENGVLREFVIGRVYIFNGYNFDNTIQCSVRDSEVIEVELHATTWVSPNAGTRVDGKQADEFDHYEIHSVYFAIDKQLLNDYGYISSIRANYDSVKLTPIVVTRPGVFDDTTKNAILNAEEITSKTDVMDLVAGQKSGLYSPEDKDYIVTKYWADWVYSEKPKVVNKLNEYKNTLAYYILAYYFENEAIPEDFDLGDLSQMTAFTSEDLEQYFYNQLSVFGVDPAALYIDYQQHLNIDYTDKDLFNLQTYEMSYGKYKKNFWQWLTSDKNTYLEEDFMTDIKKIEVIKNPALYSSISDSFYEEFSKKLVINVCDLDAFSEFCKEAASKNQAVVILRYAVADYRCTLLYDVYEAVSFYGWDTVGYSIQKSAMLNVSIAQIGFTGDKGTVVIPTVSNSVNSFGDGIIFDIVGDLGIGSTRAPDFSDLWAQIRAWLKQVKRYVMIAFAVLIIAAIILVLLRFIPGLIKTGTALRESRRQRRQAREEVKKQKNARRR